MKLHMDDCISPTNSDQREGRKEEKDWEKKAGWVTKAVNL